MASYLAFFGEALSGFFQDYFTLQLGNESRNELITPLPPKKQNAEKLKYKK
jgi:hypothetical protein